MLNRLGGKRKLHILGINSGTSADGVDLALIRFERTGRIPKAEFVDGSMIPYPPRIKKSLENIISGKIIDKETLARWDIAYGRFLGTVARKFLDNSGLTADLIGSHGQTVGHFPAYKRVIDAGLGATFQIGDGNAVASAAGLPVVHDFRRADIARGGEGAPLTPFVNHLLFGHSAESRIIVNIGGIANFSYHPAGGNLTDIGGGDCGPGNVLSDLACRLLFHKKFDRDGALAQRGEINDDIIRSVTDANRKRRISAGREQFDWQLMARIIHTARRRHGDKHDIMASVADAAARLIHRSIKRHLMDPRLEGIYLTGGGRRNLFIVKRLQIRCGKVTVLPIEALGYNGDLLEAVSFGVLAGCFVFGIPSTVPEVTGGKSGGIAGKLALPPRQIGDIVVREW